MQSPETTETATAKRRSTRDRDPFADVFVALERLPEFGRLRDALASPETRSIDVAGTVGSLAACLVARIHDQLPRPTLILAATPERATHWHDDLVHLLGEKGVARFHSWETLPYEFRLPGPEATGRRLEALWRCLEPQPPIIVTHLRAALEPTIPPADMAARVLQIERGQDVPTDDFLARLVELGYRRCPLVEEVGTFAVRGGIVDLFTYTQSEPIRLEFFGDTVESIRTFAVTTQRTTAHWERCVILPSREVVSNGSAYEQLLESATMDERWRERLDADPDHPGLEWLVGHLGCVRGRLFDYFSDQSVLWTDDPERLQAAYDELMEEATRFHDRLAQHLPDPPAPIAIYGDVDVWRDPQPFRNRVRLRDFRSGKPEAIVINAVRPPAVAGSMPRLHEELDQFAKEECNVVIACDSQGQRARLAELLLDRHVQLNLSYPALHGGFVLPGACFAFLTEHELFDRHRPRFRRRHFQEGLALSSYTQLKRGDYVVHIDHGIGHYRGLESITVEERRRDCLLLLYQGGDKLYVPVEEFDRVQKHSGREGNPSLSRLGGTTWERTKTRAKKVLLAMAEELIALYAARKARPGFAFSDDNEWLRQMEDAFIYEETPDQATAIEAVRNDMTDPSPMDRLICGDVGYGKTEVAIRAAFRAVCDGKQVGLLVPTTILAQQHLATFRDRLSEFPVRMETLSRFRSRKEQREIVADLARGKIDIVIGTHRLLQKDVQFADLGLLVIDEEHRFGVRHKEKLRQMKETVDTLALSATPIPRTLSMSLHASLDLSLINTSPRDRLPVQTEICPFGEEVIVDAVLRELDRGGQIYFVHNRVQSIAAMADYLRGILPSVKIAVAHGQMPERELEAVMTRFYHQEHDMLLCTSIIESGLDLPTVNTIIIHRADHFGLAQLYQLRGRVGRAARQAYAYLLIPPSTNLTAVARARLQAIEEHTALGSGFHLAMRDMEIRGAGNLLGPQQHGFIEEVGFDLYCRLLDEAVAEVRGETGAAPSLTPVEIEVPGDRYLPDEYVPDNQQRFEMYKRLAEVANPEGAVALGEEMADRFGSPPPEAQRLLGLAAARVWARRAGVVRAVAARNLWTLVLAADARIGRSEVEQWRRRLSQENITFAPGPPFQIRVRAPLGASADLAGLNRLLEQVAGVVADASGPRSRLLRGGGSP
ncbi:MAG TPA: transcription-repair coupling factor [Acidobacteriota bacterium]|nr:transcription-repair coupling factor [Acidobacteriota bacterium]